MVDFIFHVDDSNWIYIKFHLISITGSLVAHQTSLTYSSEQVADKINRFSFMVETSENLTVINHTREELLFIINIEFELFEERRFGAEYKYLRREKNLNHQQTRV